MTHSYLREFSERSLATIALSLAYQLPVPDRQAAADIIRERALPYVEQGRTLQFLRTVFDQAQTTTLDVALLLAETPRLRETVSIDSVVHGPSAHVR